jgi:tellurite resistance protein
VLQVKESIELKRERIKEEARLKQQKTEARIKATQSFFQQQADDAKALFELKMKENEKKRQEFEKRREEEIAMRREKAERKASELLEVAVAIYCLFSRHDFGTVGSKTFRRCRDAASC